MYIEFDSECNRTKITMDVEDYLALLKSEVAYGKVLQVFGGVLEMLVEDSYKYNLWIKDVRYKPDAIKKNMELLLEQME